MLAPTPTALRDQVSHPSKANLSPPPIRVYACLHSGPILVYATSHVATCKISCPLDQLSISDFVLTPNMERAQNLAWNALTQVSLALQWPLAFYILAAEFYL